MNHRLDELYLRWLYSLVADPDETERTRTYWNLLRKLFQTEFVWFIPNDDNRAADGTCLRDEFCEALSLHDPDPDWMELGCSMLELLLGLSRRLSFLEGGEPSDWFWHLIDNLGLRISDRRRLPVSHVEEVLSDVIWRTYHPDGVGGLFPLARTVRDQREVELWYQLNAYLIERNSTKLH